MGVEAGAKAMWPSQDTIMNSIRAIVRDLRIQSRRSEKDLGLSGAQLFVLQKLGETRATPVSINELAALTLTHQSSVSTVVSKLRKTGHVKRVESPSDRREARIALTKKGTRLLANSPLTTQERLLKGMSALSESELERLSVLLRRLLKGGGFTGLEKSDIPLFFEDSKKQAKRRKK